MKSEAQLRKHLADLRECIKRPCGCAADGHAVECFVGGKMLAANIDMLAWVLGDNPRYDEVEEHFAASARRG